MSRRAALEKRIGHRFSSPRLLEQALTHRSHGPEHNERLEFLGDGVLGCAVADELYARFPHLPEGKLTRLRASLVREEALAEAGTRIGLAEYLRIGRTEIQPSLVADSIEALLGAVFLDGGYQAARNAIVQIARERPGAARQDVIRAFENRSIIDGIDSIKGTDLTVEKGSISFAYRKEVPLFTNVALCIDYAASTGGQ